MNDFVVYKCLAQVAFFFAWLGFYTTMLIPAALIGLLVTLYGIVRVFGFGDTFTYAYGDRT